MTDTIARGLAIQAKTEADSVAAGLSATNVTVGQQGASITSLGTSVAQNTGDIATLNTSVSQNTTAIGTLNTSVAQNGAAIATLNTNVGQNTTAIATLSTNVAQNTAAIAAAQARLQFWVRSYRGVLSKFAVAATPPAVTLGGANATVNGNTAYTTSATWNGGRIVLAGQTTWASDGSSPTRAIAPVTTLSDNSVVQGPLQRVRFLTDAPAFEIPFKGVLGQVNAVIDGEIVSRTRGLLELPNDGLAHQVKFSFGANTKTLYLDLIAKSGGGSGYAVGDTITIAGGTFTTAAVLVVTQLSGTGVYTVAVVNRGAYTAVPTGTIAQASTSGAGTGATFTSPVWSAAYTTRKLRRVELLWSGVSPLAGINIGSTDAILPWPVSARIPRLLVLGDSQQNTYVDYAGGQMAYTIAQRLGLTDSLVITQNGGTGYLTPNGNALPWTDSRRINDVIVQAPDIVFIIGGQNDGGQTPASLTMAVTGMLNTLLAALPKTLFVGIGPVTSNGATITAAIVAGWAAASDQTRVRFIDNVTVPWITNYGSSVVAPSGAGNADWYVASDGVHLTQAGTEYWADIAATKVGDALVAMIG